MQIFCQAWNDLCAKRWKIKILRSIRERRIFYHQNLIAVWSGLWRRPAESARCRQFDSGAGSHNAGAQSGQNIKDALRDVHGITWCRFFVSEPLIIGAAWKSSSPCARGLQTVQNCGGGEKRKNPPKHFASADFGPSEKIRTSGLLNPIQARYQLRYTRIFYLLK